MAGIRGTSAALEAIQILSSEIRTFEHDRMQWEQDRIELSSEICRLTGQLKGSEALKHDLVRRIKMLEYALTQVIFHRLCVLFQVA